MKLALSEHSQIAASAISEGSAMPCNGAKFESRSRMASLMFIAASTIALRVTPGQNAFTRILDLAYCSAAALVSQMLACLIAVEPCRMGSACLTMPCTDDMLTHAPRPCLLLCAIGYLMPRNWLGRLT